METKDLKRGNFICLEEEVHIVDGIQPAWAWLDDNKSYCVDELSPIPLTEEWLEKLGFESYQHFTLTNRKFIKVGRNRQISVGCVGTPNEMVFLQQLIDNDNKVEDLVCLRNFDYDGKTHVHQLQNLYFALTGKELTCD